MTSHPFSPSNRAARWIPCAMLAAAAVLGGCGEKKDRANQTAAKVNKDEVSVQQVNLVLQQQRNLRPEQAEAAGKQVLERLIDQQLAVQKADELKLDRDPRVQQQLEAARREILARAYVEKIGEGAAKPTAEEARKYYDEKPALFSQRRIYNLQEIAVDARPDQVPVLREKLAATTKVGVFVEWLKANDYRFAANQAVRAAEQLPLNSLDAVAKLGDGQTLILPSPNGVQVLVVAGTRSAPVTEEQARPAIEQFLLNERKRKLVEADLKAMRAASKIEYVGKFASGAPTSAPAAGGGASSADIGKGAGIR